MKCDNCNTCNNDPCSCGKCMPARYGCDFDINANPFDSSIWNVTICGATTKVKIPKLNETDTKLSTNYSSKSLIYNAERHTDVITGDQLGSLINVEDLRDTDTTDADSCDLLVYNPHCDECGDGCKPREAKWTNYHIPDAGNCEMTADSSGRYKVLTKDDCGCIRECNLPIIPNGMTAINYIRDSVPDDPDYPWYYGSYNDKINLYLQQNASKFFGKFDLKVTVNYGVQTILSEFCPNYNFRSLVCPVVQGSTPRVANEASNLQGFCGWKADGDRSIPWGTQSLRGSFTFIVPKGKEAYLHHEYRVRTGASFPNYYTCPRDGQKVPDSEIGLNTVLFPASRLNALQIIVEPASGNTNFNPAVDTIRNQLDPVEDEYPNPWG